MTNYERLDINRLKIPRSLKTCAYNNNKVNFSSISFIYIHIELVNFALITLKADFQSSHEAPRSSLRVMHEHFHPITMRNSSF